MDNMNKNSEVKESADGWENKKIMTYVLIMVTVIVLLIVAKCMLLNKDNFYYSPYNGSDCSSCVLNPHFHGNGYDYVNHRFNLANQRGMKIGYGYMHDLRNNADWTPFPVIQYTMQNCPYCVQFKNSGTWEQLNNKYGDKVQFKVVDREDAPAYITSFPTFVAEVGERKVKYNGPRDYESMKAWLNQLLIMKA